MPGCRLMFTFHALPFGGFFVPRIAPILFITLYGTLESAPYSFFSLASRKAGMLFLVFRFVAFAAVGALHRRQSGVFI